MFFYEEIISSALLALLWKEIQFILILVYKRMIIYSSLETESGRQDFILRIIWLPKTFMSIFKCGNLNFVAEFGRIRMKIAMRVLWLLLVLVGSTVSLLIRAITMCLNLNSQHMVFTTCHTQLIICIARVRTSFFWVQSLFW